MVSARDMSGSILEGWITFNSLVASRSRGHLCVRDLVTSCERQI
jgi:hypothetical protein